jgi:hypothetical protein
MNYADLLVVSLLKPFIIGLLVIAIITLLFLMPTAFLSVFVAFGVLSLIAKMAGILDKD